MVKDLTNGKPLKLIINFCLPLMLGQLFQQLYNMVDSIIVGKFAGTAELSAVGATGSLVFLVLGFVNGFTSGITIPIAQTFGTGKQSRLRKLFVNGIYLTVFTTIFLTATTFTLAKTLLRLMNTPDDIFQMAYDYIATIFLGLVATFFYNLIAAVMRSLGDSKTPLILLIFSSVINIGLDLFFVIVLKMACLGVAIATVIAQALSAILGIIIIVKKYDILRFSKDEARLSVEMISRLSASGVPMALQFSVTAIGSIMLQSAVNILGETVIAAVTVASKIQLLIILPSESIGITMATYCGQNLGAERLDRIESGTVVSLILANIYAVAAGMISYFFGSKMGILFVSADQTEILNYVGQFLRTACFFYPVLAVLFIFRNSIQGLGYSTSAMFAGAFELVARGIMGYIIIPKFGYDAVCYANPSAWFAADLFLIPAFVIVYFIVKKKTDSVRTL